MVKKAIIARADTPFMLTFEDVMFDEFSSQCTVSEASAPTSNFDIFAFIASELSLLPLLTVPVIPVLSNPNDRFTENLLVLKFIPTDDKLTLSLLFLRYTVTGLE